MQHVSVTSRLPHRTPNLNFSPRGHHSGRAIQKIKQCTYGVETNSHILNLLQPQYSFTDGLFVRITNQQMASALTSSSSLLNYVSTLSQSLEAPPLEWSELLQKIRSISFISKLQVGRIARQRNTFKILKMYLKETKELNDLTISCESMTVNGAKQLAQGLKTNTSIEGLNLSQNGLNVSQTKIIMESLQRHPSLKELSLSINNIGIDAAKYVGDFLKKHHKLETCSLGLNPLGDEGLAFIAQSLTENKSLKKLCLRECGITTVGAQLLFQYLEKHPSIKEVDLRWNHINSDTCHKLQEWAKDRVILHLEYNIPLIN